MTFTRELLVAAVASAFAFAGTATAMTKGEINAENNQIAAQFKTAKARCNSLKANARDICMAEATGANKVAKAELAARQNDTLQARYNARVVKVDADYAVAREKCDDLAGNVKDVCVKDAKAARTTAKADAKADMAVRAVKRGAREKISEVRKDAAEEKRDADYAAAKERCDTYAGNAKDRCIADAKARLGMK